MLGVTSKTAWFTTHGLLEAMKGRGGDGSLGGQNEVIEVDETYVGGKARNRAFRAPAKKKAVVALIQRDGHLRSFHVVNVNAKHLRGLTAAASIISGIIMISSEQ